ncbi:hypothetical protein diail_8397 [Diaporthe ilicicola]|nr:hypothetical protein diail_8397 [Diaporthe ilicicola]
MANFNVGSPLNHYSKEIEETTSNITPSSIFEIQAYCNSCYRTAYQLKVHRKETLDSCQDCHVVFKCQECEWNHANKTCKFYQLLSDEQFFSVDLFNTRGNAILQMPVPVPLETFTEMGSLSGWFDYYKKLHGGQQMEAFIEPNEFSFAPGPTGTKSTCISKEDEQYAKNQWARLRAATMASTVSMTIANALYAGLPDLRARTSLLIHIVEAAGTEYRVMMMFEEILHLFPNLSTIKVFLIGLKTPEATDEDGRSPHSNLIDHECCRPCTAKGRKRSVATYRGLYHGFANMKPYTKSDLMILFNSGRSQAEIELLAPATRFLVDQGITTACTTYTKNEADEEMAELKHTLQAKIIQPIEENKWKGLVPRLKKVEEVETSVYYANYYWYMFKGKV